MNRFGVVAVVAGLGFYLLAFVVIGALPLREFQVGDANYITVNGERLPAVVAFATGDKIPVPSPYDGKPNGDMGPQVRVLTVEDELEIALGREIYLREGCWLCHSQFVRPVGGDEDRYGPVSQAGETAWDVPHAFGTKRTGPDLAREGGKRTDDWHASHFWNPRSVVPQSIMPRFTWLFDGKDQYGVPELSEEGIGLVAYLQYMGTGIGRWRTEIPGVSFPRPEGTVRLPLAERRARGQVTFEMKCLGCHGANGTPYVADPAKAGSYVSRASDERAAKTKSVSNRGDGEAAPFLDPKPRDFTRGVYKFRRTPDGQLPSDEDLFRTITRGVNGTSMPDWITISSTDRWYLVDYIKSFAVDRRGNPQFENKRKLARAVPMALPEPVQVTTQTIAEGRMMYLALQCWNCHGNDGAGNGPAAADRIDDWGYTTLPKNFRAERTTIFSSTFKGGSFDRDVYRTFSTGLSGSAMPAFDVKIPREGLLSTAQKILPEAVFPPVAGSEAEERFEQAEIDAMVTWAEMQPSAQEVRAMSDSDKAAMEARRKWALVHYVKSVAGLTGSDASAQAHAGL